MVHNKTITNDTLDEYLCIIQEYSDSEHEHVRKAISWALREIGKKNFTYNEKAILLANNKPPNEVNFYFLSIEVE